MLKKANDQISTIPVSRKTLNRLRRIKAEIAASVGEDITWDKAMNVLLDIVEGKDFESAVARLKLSLKVLERVLQEMSKEDLVAYSCFPGLYRDYNSYEEYDLCLNNVKIVVRYDDVNDRMRVVRVELNA